jgi:hypothetical protein
MLRIPEVIFLSPSSHKHVEHFKLVHEDFFIIHNSLTILQLAAISHELLTALLN